MVELVHVKSTDLSTVKLTSDHHMVRESIRPKNKRADDFDELFDHDTLYFDAFPDPVRNRTICVGPPFLNMFQPFERGTCYREHNGVTEEVPFNLVDKVRLGGTQILAPSEPGDQITFRNDEIGDISFSVGENRNAFLKGKRVLWGMVRFDQKPWILDWVRFHVRIHGASAVLIYNHMSDNFTSEELLKGLSQVEGLETAIVVDWNFKWGPLGGVTGNKKWVRDSDFCKFGVIEHARSNFLQDVEAVLMCDVDELVVCKNEESVFDIARDSALGYVTFHGHYVTAGKKLWEIPFADRRHRQVFTVSESLNKSKRCPEKYVVVPSRMPRDIQWTIHGVSGMSMENWLAGRVVFRHFRHINENWRLDRNWVPGPFRRDKNLIRDFKKMGWLRADF